MSQTLLRVLPPSRPGPCDPRPLLLAAAMSGRFAAAELPKDLEWARAGLTHVLPSSSTHEGVTPAEVPADVLMAVDDLKRLADGQPVALPMSADALTAYHWFYNVLALPQLTRGPVVFGTDTPPNMLPLIRPQEGRALWIGVQLGHGVPRLWACGRAAFGRECWEDLGEVTAELRPGHYSLPQDPSPHTAFLLADIAREVIRAARAGDRERVCRLVNVAWGKEKSSGSVAATDLAVLSVLEERPGHIAARPTSNGLLVISV